jgi:dihydroneopterin aldolase
MNANPDEIHLRGLDLPARIGVPDEERAGWQNLRLDLVLRTACRFEAMADDIQATPDYAAVAARVRALAAERPRRLIETLAAELAACLLAEFPVVSVSVEVRKRVLPGCDEVSVKLTRTAAAW